MDTESPGLDTDKFDVQQYITGSILLQENYGIDSILLEREHFVFVTATHHESKKRYCIKILNSGLNLIGENEVSILKELNSQDNRDKSHIIKLIDSFVEGEHYCIVTEPVKSFQSFIKDLSKEELSFTEIRFYAVQILSALAFLKNCNVVHSDLRLDSIFIKDSVSPQQDDGEVLDKNKLYLKLGNFGSAFHVSNAPQILATRSNLQSLPIRSPEVILHHEHIGCAIDMWSFAWDLVEMQLGFQLFDVPTTHQLIGRMYEMLGPFPEVFNQAKEYQHFFDNQHKPIVPSSEVPNPNTPKLSASAFITDTSLSLLLDASRDREHQLYVEFISQMLIYDPQRRLSPSEALTHPFLFPQSLDFHAAFVEFNLNIEKERMALKNYFDKVANKMKEDHEAEKKKMEQQFEHRVENINELHINQIKELETSHQLETEARKTDFEMQIEALERAIIKKDEERKNMLQKVEAQLKEKFDEDKKKIQEHYENMLATNEEKYNDAQGTIAELKKSINHLQNLLNDTQPPQQQTVPTKKRKPTQFDNANFDEMVQQRQRPSAVDISEESPPSHQQTKDKKSPSASPSKKKPKNVFGGSTKAAKTVIQMLSD